MRSSILADLRYALRGLIKNPVFSLVAVLSLALGIGLNTAVFTVVDGVLFRPKPVSDPGSLVNVFTADTTGEPNGTTSWADFNDLRNTNTVFTDMVGHSVMMAAFGTDGNNRLILGEVVTANYFDALGVPLAMGRGFLPEEERTERGHPVVVLSHRLWQSRFGGRTDVVGQSVVIHSRPYTIVGVAPSTFHGLAPGLDSEIWIPVSMVDDVEPITMNEVDPSPGNTRLERRGHRWLFALGRLRPGVSAAAAEANLDAIMAGLAAAYPASNTDRAASVVPSSKVRLHPLVDAELLPSGLVLLGAVSLVLLVACGNLASMLLARGVSRSKEFALRAALGAPRRRLIRQLLVENVVLALTGGAAGLVVGAWVLRWLATIETPLQLSVPMSFAIDLRVLAFTFLLSLGTGLLFGLLPAWRSSRTNLVSDLKADAPLTGAAGRRFGAGQVLVAGQVAVSLVLLVGGLLMVRSVTAARDIDTGIDARGIALVSVNLGFHGYSEGDARQFFERAVERLSRLPGVSAVGLSDRLPFSPNVHQTTVVVDGRPEATPPTGLTIDNTRVSPAYFDAMGLPVIEGRPFDSHDAPGAVHAAIINRTLAERLWPGESAVGKRLRFRDQSGGLIEVVGVVRDHKVRTLGEAPRAFIHFARAQSEPPWGTFVARTSGAVDATVAAMSREVLALDPNVVLMEAQPFDRLITLSLLPVRLGATLIGSLAALAMLLSAIGLYGLLAFSVSRRTREIGIRMALGADRRRVLLHIMREGLVLVAIGSAVGFVLAALGARTLGAVLHVPALDPVSYIAAAALFGLTAALAAGIPARRAASTNPIEVLKGA
ncbi:MAG TPA: ABC transporter permease [Vicinamibacterales bacterium]|nr:ABC transporter permease [Vicinamibacterales bacterium]